MEQNEKLDKVLDGVQEIKTSVAVLDTRFDNMERRINGHDRRLDNANKEFQESKLEITGSINKELKELNRRVDKHDKILAGVVIAYTIVLALMKLKII